MIRKFSEYRIIEKLDLEKLDAKMTDDYKDLKNDLIEMINNILEEESDESIKNADLIIFINDYIKKGKTSNLISGLIEDNDVFNFYLKHQSDVDQLLNSTGYLDKSPKDNNVFSLYDIIMDGTKDAIVEILKNIKKEIE